VTGVRRKPIPRTLVWVSALTVMAIAGIVSWVVTVGLDTISARTASDPKASPSASSSQDLERERDTAPLAVDVESTGSLAGAVVPLGEDEVMEASHPDSAADLADWVKGHSGIWVDRGSVLMLNAYGTVESPVIIRSIRAVQISCSTPEGPWTWLKTGGGGAYGAFPAHIGFPQDGTSESLPAVEVPFNAEEWSFPRQVSQAEAEGYDIEVQVPAGMVCAFALEFSITAGSNDDLVVVDNDGEAFVVADQRVAEGRIIDLGD